MKRKKNILCLCISALLISGLVGCGTESGDNNARDDEKMGNTEYVAKIIQETVGGDLFRIETTEKYPLDHNPLVDQAAEEQDAGLRPVLSSHVEDFEKYETLERAKKIAG